MTAVPVERKPVALITGAAGGIGEACAQRLARDGWSIAALDLAPFDGASDDWLTFQGSVTDEDFCNRVVAQVDERWGAIDGLIHCAGTDGSPASVVDMTLDGFRSVVEVNLVGTFLVARAVVRQMLAHQSRGSLVLVGSTGGRVGNPQDSHYAASKAGVHLFMQSLSRELGPAGIRVNAIAPGPVLTNMSRRYLQSIADERGESFEAVLEGSKDLVPLHRIGMPEEVAASAAWLLSPDASFVTSQTIGVDGGAVPSS